MNELISQYTDSLKIVRQLQKKANDKDKALLSGMASDLEFALTWMKTGRRPGNRRGVERLAAYQRERCYDPLVIQKFFRSTSDEYYWSEDGSEEDLISEWNRERIEQALARLTAREKEIYIMSRGAVMSYEQIAAMLAISKSTVQTTIQRAEKKIAAQVAQDDLHLA